MSELTVAQTQENIIKLHEELIRELKSQIAWKDLLIDFLKNETKRQHQVIQSMGS